MLMEHFGELTTIDEFCSICRFHRFVTLDTSLSKSVGSFEVGDVVPVFGRVLFWLSLKTKNPRRKEESGKLRNFPFAWLAFYL